MHARIWISVVLPWLRVASLQGLAARRGPCSDPASERLLMSESSARYYLACLLEALGYLHGRNLLHRDVSAPHRYCCIPVAAFY